MIALALWANHLWWCPLGNQRELLGNAWIAYSIADIGVK
jgi:hypothetical protein